MTDAKNPVIRPWKHKHWGIAFKSGFNNEPETLIGRTWKSRDLYQSYPGEPPRTLLFETRRQAREFCTEKHAQLKYSCPKWRFRPVRVNEIVEVIE